MNNLITKEKELMNLLIYLKLNDKSIGDVPQDLGSCTFNEWVLSFLKDKEINVELYYTSLEWIINNDNFIKYHNKHFFELAFKQDILEIQAYT